MTGKGTGSDLTSECFRSKECLDLSHGKKVNSTFFGNDEKMIKKMITMMIMMMIKIMKAIVMMMS